MSTKIFGSSDLTPTLNSKQLSQALNLTAGATAAIAVPTDLRYKNTTNSFVFGGIFSLPSWTVATVLKSCLSGGVGYQLEVVVTTGVFRVTLNTTTYNSTIPGGGVASQLLPNSTHFVLAVVTVGATTTIVSFYLDGYLLNTAAAQANVDVTNTNTYYLGGTSTNRYAMTIYNSYDYNKSLTSAEVLDLFYNGVNFADKWGSQTQLITGDNSTFASDTGWWTKSTGVTIADGVCHFVNVARWESLRKTLLSEFKNFELCITLSNLVSGSIVIYYGGVGVQILSSIGTYVVQGKSYNNNSLAIVANVDNTTVDIDNITLKEIGSTLTYEPNRIQPPPGQILDSSTNKLHALQPATGSSLTQPKYDFEVRDTLVWSGTHEAKYINTNYGNVASTGTNQAVLPPNCYITEIIGEISGGTIEDIKIGDGGAGGTERWVATTTGLTTGIVSFTIANHISDGTNYKMVVDPDANFTGQIIFTIRGIINT